MVLELGGPGGPLAPPIFGRSVNPIPTAGEQIMPTITTGPPMDVNAQMRDWLQENLVYAQLNLHAASIVKPKAKLLVDVLDGSASAWPVSPQILLCFPSMRINKIAYSINKNYFYPVLNIYFS